MIIGSLMTKVTPKEKEERELLFKVPEEEKDPKEIKKTKMIIASSIPLGMLITVALRVLLVVPYLKGK